MNKPKRSVLVVLIAVAQIVVGVGLFCTGGCGVISTAAGSSAATVTASKNGKPTTFVYDTREEMEREAPGYKVFLLGSSVAGLGLAVAMLVSAVGLLLQKGWGWWLSLAWGVLEVGYQAGVAVYLWMVAMPAANRVVKVVPRDDAGVCSGLVNGNTFYHFFWAIFASGFWLYPALVLLLLVLPPVRRSSRPVDESSPYEDEEEEDDRPRRRRRDEEDEDRDRPRRRRDRDDD